MCCHSNTSQVSTELTSGQVDPIEDWIFTSHRCFDEEHKTGPGVFSGPVDRNSPILYRQNPGVGGGGMAVNLNGKVNGRDFTHNHSDSRSESRRHTEIRLVTEEDRNKREDV